MTDVSKFRSTGKDIDGYVELIYEEGPFQGISWTYSAMKFADKENDDGSIQMSFDYEITGAEQPKDKTAFEQSIGDVILHVLEEQVAKGEVVYANGTVDAGTDTQSSDADI